MRVGANYQGNDHCQFVVWAPLREQVAVELIEPVYRMIPMQSQSRGYWQVQVEGIKPGTLYRYRLDDEVSRPDPASHSQPQDVHGLSAVIDHADFNWHDQSWQGLALEEWVIYELHVGTFTAMGTFAAIIPRLEDLVDLGITAIELMPVAQFPGDRNWGYDGAYPYAVQASYGGPTELKKLVDACHQRGIAVILDVVYNHFGPEGCYIENFAPYWTDRYQTPWGRAVNFDGAHSDGVRNFFIENALYWLRDYHIDALRLDAVHAIYDFGAKHFLAELATAIASFSQEQGRRYYLIAESDLNDVQVIQPLEKRGYGIDAQWSDDFHHALHTILTGERTGYYEDFGHLQQLAKAYRSSFVYSWQYSVHRQRFHGSDASCCPPVQFIVYTQNHDQIGNRMWGERLSHLVSFEKLKLAAGALLLSPYIPLLFMGEEYGEDAPFLYLISHTDSDLVQAVREGRQREFAPFHGKDEPPDAFSLETFQKSKLNWEQRQQGKHQVLLVLYRELIRLRRDIPALGIGDRAQLKVNCLEEQKVLLIQRWHEASQVLIGLNFGDRAASIRPQLPPGLWHRHLDSSDSQWLGTGTLAPPVLEGSELNLSLVASSFVLYVLQ